MDWTLEMKSKRKVKSCAIVNCERLVTINRLGNRFSGKFRIERTKLHAIW